MELNAKYDDLSTLVNKLNGTGQPHVESAPLVSPNQQAPTNSQLTTPENAELTSPHGQYDSVYVPSSFSSGQVDTQTPLDNQKSFAAASHSNSIKVGSSVVLKSLANINEIVATGIVDEMENIRVNGIDLGTDFCKVVIQYQVKKDARLIFPYNHIQTIGSALGVPVAWPLSLVVLDDDQFHM